MNGPQRMLGGTSAAASDLVLRTQSRDRGEAWDPHSEERRGSVGVCAQGQVAAVAAASLHRGQAPGQGPVSHTCHGVLKPLGDAEWA